MRMIQFETIQFHTIQFETIQFEMVPRPGAILCRPDSGVD
jgi:hypothetical protein